MPAARRIFACMERNRKLHRSARATSKPAAFELPPERAFVVHLDVRAQPPRRVVGRVEHVTSGQVAHVTCLHELVAFMAKVLRNQRRGKRGTARATPAQEPSQSQLASSARGFLGDDAARSAAQSTLRSRKGRGES
jgi:hypothetical protein